MINTPISPWNRFVRLLKMERRDILQIFYFAIFSGLVTLSLPLGIQAIINLIQGAQFSTSWIILVLLVSGGVVFSGSLQLMQLRIIETLQQRIFTRIGFDLAYRLPKMQSKHLKDYYLPELTNRFFDTLTIQKGLSKILLDVPAALLQILFALILLTFYHPFFIVFGLSLLILMFFVFNYTIKKGLETSLKESKKKYKVAYWLQQISRNIWSFKMSGNSSLALDKNNDLVNDYLESRESHFKILRIQFMKMIGFKVVITSGLLLIGGGLVLNQKMNIGQFVAAEIIILLVISSIEKLILGLESGYDMITSLEKIGQVMDLELEKSTGSKPNFDKEFSIELSKVSWKESYHSEHILTDVNLQIDSKSKIWIQGNSNSGKSTLIQLIAGIKQVGQGQITVNNHHLDSININYFRNNIGVCFTNEWPFEGTLKENLTFGNENISDEEILNVFKTLELENYYKTLSEGLDSKLFPEGQNLSKSEAKKIVLARAILKKPKLLVLENTLDNLESDEANRIFKNLSTDGNWALLVVSTNQNWANYCQTKITMREGKIQFKEDLNV